MRTAKIIAAGAAAAAMVGLLGTPAMAAPSDTTDVTFLLEGSLDITAPPTADLGSGVPGGTISAQLGEVAVNDSRGAADASWTASVVSTDFTTGAAAADQTVLASQVDYWSGPTVGTPTGNGTFSPQQTTSAAAAPLDNTTLLDAYIHTGGSGGNTASWNPTLVVNVPLANLAGTYTGTVTHSVL
ncbi:hypothetical protein [Micromonospora sp. DH14]|uniref:hypothetical protein n=1 Tax=Micromonospora sp. DH14 TaxID=3040120 RepID=UPI002441ADBC|nr:hypothetical protein [Micromonospora sp. DH14]MDG9673375.1 hypothetical protein [Micromonospora sp. DH14]